ncbi:hypothetical protein [Halomicrococcus sp. SG-WS-1]|uniref:hypothetical protein n=1 Tax=Halomicrococcus sp. SG-WS-1 TaxID=3439057 RepID=UPI003F7B0DB7
MQFIVRWARSVGRRFRDAEDQEESVNDTETTLQDESRSSLFHRPDCKAVYIDTDKNTCSTCNTTVERVPSTLAETV